jgi:tRNA A-37 threonylcarbamoyl transferase component Bud32
MEVVKGHTVRQIINKFPEYWMANKKTIKTALHKLIDALTEKNFFIIDLNDDNIMWNVETNILTYIDIGRASFDYKDDVDKNLDLHYSFVEML